MNRVIPPSWLSIPPRLGRLAVFIALALFWVAPVTAQDGGTTHTVQAGENLYRIALQYGLTVADLVASNDISDPTRIYAGQVLVIPVETTADTETTLHNAAVNPAPDTSTYHTVAAGETLISIADAYGMDWLDLAAANGLGEPSNIIVGQKLLIPSATSTLTIADATATEDTVSEDAVSENTASEDTTTDNTVTADAVTETAASEAATSEDTSADTDTTATDEEYYIPDQVTEIRPPSTTASNMITTEDGYTIPDQVAAVSPAPSALDLGILPVDTAQDTTTTTTTESVATTSTTSTTTTAVNPIVSASGERTHIVQAGEHLSSIAAQYGLSYPTLAMANNISDPNQIYSGQTLIIPDQDYAPSSYVAQTAATTTAAAATISTGKQIVVDLSDQRVYLYEDGALLRNVLVSTGTAAYPTVQGDYKIYLKYESQTMTGPGYNLPGVPYVLYFYKGYSLHGTYWHSNFGTPMSHGCVNMPTSEAQWLYNWAPIGTAVHVQW